MKPPNLTILEARAAMRSGAIMIRQKGKSNDRFFIEPGGQISRKTWTTLRLITNVIDNRDGVQGQSQSWSWRV